MKHLLPLLLALICLFPCTAFGADFKKAAHEVKQDLALAEQEQKQTQAQIQEKTDAIQKRLASLKLKLQQENDGLELARKRLEEAHVKKQELQIDLADKKGDLEELAGNVRSASRDLLALAERSPITAEMPGRFEHLKSLLAKKHFPGLEEIKGLIENYMCEIKAGTRVIRRQGKLVGESGLEKTGEIIRLGGLTTIYRTGEQIGFALVSPTSGRLIATGGEPSWMVGRVLEEYLRSESTDVCMDISSGAALRRLVKRSGAWERILSGGPLVWPILAVGLIALILILERLIFMQRVRSNTDHMMSEVNHLVSEGEYEKALEAAQAKKGRPTSNVIIAGLALKGCSAEVVEGGLSEAMLKELPRLERFLTALKVLAAVAPLLGLLGTVTGMINTFRVITIFGSGDPRLMAGGISEALITTQLGLAVAIPVMVAAALLSRKAQRITEDMEEKAVSLSAALIRENGS